MVAMLIGCFFAAVAGFTVVAIMTTGRTYAGQWSALAAERQRLSERARERADEAAVAGVGFPRTVNVRRPAEAGQVVYQRRFMARSETTPLRPARRAAA